jgi:hypothetical protein
MFVLKIFNNEGKLVVNKPINKNKSFIDINGFNPGFYLISIKSGDKTIVKKILVKD